MESGIQLWLMIFVGVTAAAVVVQLIVLIGVASAVKRTGERVRAMAEQFETRGLPLIGVAQQTLTSAQAMLAESKPKIELTVTTAQETLVTAQQTLTSAQSMIAETRPKVDSAVKNLTESAAKIKARVDKVDEEFEPLIERVKVQAVRIDDVVTRTVDRVEVVSNLFERGVKRPATRASGVWHGLAAGLSVLRGKRPPNSKRPGQKDEMFI
jgi:hypothetical protein